MRPKRRQLLKYIGVLSAGAAGTFAYLNPGVVKGNPVTGPPPTENKIKERRFSFSLIDKIEFFESGAAVITPQSDHGCFERIGFTHADLTLVPESGESLAIWDLQSFDEPLTVDLKSAIESRDSYPRNEFKMRAMAGVGNTCISQGGVDINFTVPDSFMP